MKICLKRVFSLICAFALTITAISYFVVPASALETGDEFIFSEYEYITTVREMSDEELEAGDLTVSEVQMLRSNAIENEILSRKELADDELISRYGYTYDDISVLRNYEGGRLENHPELAAITGILKIYTPEVLTATKSRIGLKVEWNWEHGPIVTATDVFAVYWSPTFGSSNGNMRIDMTNSSHSVTYVPANQGYTYDWDITQVTPNSAVKSTFAMLDQTRDYWAKSGVMTLYFDAAAGSAALTEIDFIFAYGHTILSVSPSVSFPVSGGISFGMSTEEADRLSGYINVGDKKWHDN